MKTPKPIRWLPPGVMRLATIGVELAAAIIGFALLGYWIDYHFKSSPWGLLICALLGITGGLYNLIRQAVHEMFRPPGSEDEKRRIKQDRDPGQGE